MRFVNNLLWLATSALLGWTGCNPSSFNSALDHAPVVSFGPSGSSTSALSILALEPPVDTKVAARMLVSSRTDKPYLAVAEFDKDGKSTMRVANSKELANLGVDSQGIVYSAAARSDGSILLGTPALTAGAGGIDVLTLNPQADGSLGFGIQPGARGASHFGIAVATGNITGSSTGESVVVSDDSVFVFGADAVSPVTQTVGCAAVSFADPNNRYAVRPVAVGDLLAGGGDEIVLGGQLNGQGQGRVAILQYDAGTRTLVCPSLNKLLAQQGGAPGFGASLAVGDFDGDGVADLAVGSPPDMVYVYLGPLDNVNEPSVTLLSAAINTDFGRRISTFRPDGAAVAQLLVSAPRAGQGKVMLFNIARGSGTVSSTSAVATLFDSNQDVGPGEFGASNVGGLKFNTSLCAPGGPVQLVPWASTNSEILTFFAYPAGPADPRCFK